ncbi:MAG: hypothetical protein ACXWIW_10135 [Croceibacterium sp.]
MADLALAAPEVPGAAEPGNGRTLFGEDRAWLALLASVTAIELAWWTLAWSLGIAPAPFLLTYLGAAFGGARLRGPAAKGAATARGQSRLG